MDNQSKEFGVEAARGVLSKAIPGSALAKVLEKSPVTFHPGTTADVRRWFTLHAGQMVHTVQCTVATEAPLRAYNGWQPGPRRVAKVTSRQVQMDKPVEGGRADSSWIDLRYMVRVGFSDGDVMVTWRDGFNHVTIYWVER